MGSHRAPSEMGFWSLRAVTLRSDLLAHQGALEARGWEMGVGDMTWGRMVT